MSIEDDSWDLIFLKRKKQIEQRPPLSVHSSRSSSPTKPTTPFSSPDTRRQSKSPPLFILWEDIAFLVDFPHCTVPLMLRSEAGIETNHRIISGRRLLPKVLPLCFAPAKETEKDPLLTTGSDEGIRKTAWIGERGNLTALLIEKAWADPQPLAHSKIQMTNWLELQREKGESAHDAWKVGEESDSKPSAIDHSQHRHNLVAATSQAHQMQTWLLLALARPSTASTADAADRHVPSIAKEVAELVLWDLDSDFPYSSLNPMGNPSLSAPEPNESVWYAEASPSRTNSASKSALSYTSPYRMWDSKESKRTRQDSELLIL
ncbi:hypothetical protein RIF29_47165 [Crotalaria pallida]|uniref:Uncharacterized protein n=1 Tax=Crotalaria pallida TaxID=3830 RepID=A0AAN9HJ19_CROPI